MKFLLEDCLEPPIWEPRVYAFPWYRADGHPEDFLSRFLTCGGGGRRFAQLEEATMAAHRHLQYNGAILGDPGVVPAAHSSQRLRAHCGGLLVLWHCSCVVGCTRRLDVGWLVGCFDFLINGVLSRFCSGGKKVSLSMSSLSWYVASVMYNLSLDIILEEEDNLSCLLPKCFRGWLIHEKYFLIILGSVLVSRCFATEGLLQVLMCSLIPLAGIFALSHHNIPMYFSLRTAPRWLCPFWIMRFCISECRRSGLPFFDVSIFDVWLLVLVLLRQIYRSPWSNTHWCSLYLMSGVDVISGAIWRSTRYNTRHTRTLWFPC